MLELDLYDFLILCSNKSARAGQYIHRRPFGTSYPFCKCHMFSARRPGKNVTFTIVVWPTAIRDCDWSRCGHVQFAQATLTRTPVWHYRSILKVNVARCVAVRNVTRLARLRKFFHLSFSWIFFSKIYGQTLLKLAVNLFSRRKQFKRTKIRLSCLSISTSFFIRHLTTRQGSSLKNPPLIIFVDCLYNVSNMTINFFIFILKKISNETWKNDISYIEPTGCFC